MVCIHIYLYTYIHIYIYISWYIEHIVYCTWYIVFTVGGPGGPGGGSMGGSFLSGPQRRVLLRDSILNLAHTYQAYDLSVEIFHLQGHRSLCHRLGSDRILTGHVLDQNIIKSRPGVYHRARPGQGTSGAPSTNTARQTIPANLCQGSRAGPMQGARYLRHYGSRP